jgi:spectinomycin phosphotransferase
LRSGAFDETTIIIPKFLHERGIQSVIAPLPTCSQTLWASLDNFKVMVFPFVEGRDGYEITLSDRHWIDFGRALKALHTIQLPPSVMNHIPQEQYSDKWREKVKWFQALIEDKQFDEPVVVKLAAFLKRKKDVVSELVRRAECFAAVLQTQSHPFVLCHADIHAGNVFIDTDSRLYIVDWDTLTLATKERDLMFIGGGLFANHRSAEEEERLFYQGYGQTEINPIVRAYYRYERIVQDIVAYCEELLLTDEGGADRENGLRQLMNQFQSNGVIEMAYRSEKRLTRF